MSALNHFLRIEQTGTVDPAAQAWLVSGLPRWGPSGYDPAMLLICLGLPCTGAKMRQAVRDWHLCCAADLFGPGLSVYGRAAVLALAARRFEGSKWEVWRRADRAPDHATPIEAALYQARKAAPFPCSKRQFINILQDAGL